MVNVTAAGFQEAQVPPVPAVIKVTAQKYVKNKYKCRTNPCAELRYIVTEKGSASGLR